MTWLYPALALAQEVPNGDFDLASTGWTAEAGADLTIFQVPTEGPALLVTREAAPAVVCSSPFVVTRDEVLADMVNVGGLHLVSWWLEDPNVEGRIVEARVLPISVGLATYALDGADQCSRAVRVCVEPEEETVLDEQTLFDRFLLSGAPCPEFVDLDGDGWCASGLDGDADGECAGPGEVTEPADCDDSSEVVFPGASEACNGLDDDCDGQVDEDLLVDWWPDEDGDGLGAAGEPLSACEAPPGYVSAGGDCDDRDPTVQTNCEGRGEGTSRAGEPVGSEAVGCGCGQGGAGPAAWVLLPLALGRVFRRRSG